MHYGDDQTPPVRRLDPIERLERWYMYLLKRINNDFLLHAIRRRSQDLGERILPYLATRITNDERMQGYLKQLVPHPSDLSNLERLYYLTVARPPFPPRESKAIVTGRLNWLLFKYFNPPIQPESDKDDPAPNE